MNTLNANIRLITLPFIDSMVLDYFVGPAIFRLHWVIMAFEWSL